MLNQNFALNISTCLTGSAFSFDELILETKNLFEREGILGFLKVLVALIDSMVVEHWIAKEDLKCCDSPSLVRSGKRGKRIYTSLGRFKLECSRLRCKSCNKTYLPLKDFLGFSRNQSKSSELEKLCLETIARESYRKSAQTIANLRPVEFGHRTLHRWVMRTEGAEIKVAHDDLETLMGDGTKFKKFVPVEKLERKNLIRKKLNLPTEKVSNRGEVKIMVGVTKSGEVKPLGAWAAESWKVIGNAIYRANNPDRRLAPKKVANMLVVDGEIGLGNGLMKLVHHKQRCQWHIPHELRPLMKYQDKAPEEDVKHAMDQVSSIFQIEIPEKDFDKVTEEEKVAIYEKIKECEMQMKVLSDLLEHKGHSQAATYVLNAKDDLFNYLKLWLKTGIVTPRVTSKLERFMRELNRRIKKFAFNWSDKGVAIISRIILKLICSPKEWEYYWDKRMKLSGNIRLTFAGVSSGREPI